MAEMTYIFDPRSSPKLRETPRTFTPSYFQHTITYNHEIALEYICVDRTSISTMKNNYRLINFMLISLLLGCGLTAAGSLIFGVLIDIWKQGLVNIIQHDFAYGLFVAVSGFVFALLPALIASLCIAIIVWKWEANNSTATGFWAGILAGVSCSAIIEWVFYLFLDSAKMSWLANIGLSVIIGGYLALAIILSGLIGIVYSVLLKGIYRNYFNMPLSIHYNGT